jgi:glycosyl transferase family 2
VCDRDHLIAWPDSEPRKREVQGIGTAVETDTVEAAYECGEVALELLNDRAEHVVRLFEDRVDVSVDLRLMSEVAGTRIGGVDRHRDVIDRPRPQVKKSRSIPGRAVHLYAQTWNEGEMLPFFFRHYDEFVDRYVVYDDGSTDDTLSLLEAHPKAEVRRFPRAADADSFVLSEQALANECWKESRGVADWVIVTDVDEHLVHPNGRQYLTGCSAAGVTLIPALGFQMVSDTFPEASECLMRSRRAGAPWIQMMKPSIFAPDAISEMNFAVGRHRAEPVGRVMLPAHDELVLLHYKYMNFEKTLERHRELNHKLGGVDREHGWGHKYSWSEVELRRDWEAVKRDAIDWSEATRDQNWRYPFVPWWNVYPRAE